MKKDIRKQYNDFAKTFSREQKEKDQTNRSCMYSFIEKRLDGKKVLDIGCGDGIDTDYYHALGANVVGVDASEELINIAKKKYPKNTFRVALAENLPYAENSFDAVYSKYAIMTSADLKPIFKEVARVLKPGGEFVYLATHPFRQYLELKDLSSDYFKQKEVKLNCLGGTVEINEPTHTFNNYLSPDFFQHFTIKIFVEVNDPAADAMYGGNHPGFFVIRAIKK